MKLSPGLTVAAIFVGLVALLLLAEWAGVAIHIRGQ